MLIYLIEQEGQTMATPNQQPDRDASMRERGVDNPQVAKESDASENSVAQERVRALGREIAERSKGLNNRLA